MKGKHRGRGEMSRSEWENVIGRAELPNPACRTVIIKTNRNCHMALRPKEKEKEKEKELKKELKISFIGIKERK